MKLLMIFVTSKETLPAKRGTHFAAHQNSNLIF